jgi:hypothetical protein
MLDCTESLERSILADMDRQGFAFRPAAETRRLLPIEACSDWPQVATRWADMPQDRYMADGGRYRFRRYATLSARAGESLARLGPHQPHYQSLAYNRLNGGVPRHFAPIPPEVIGGATLARVFAFCGRVFSALRPRTDWHIEAHQFRIEARADAAGLPTPEGMHRDGVDFVLVMLVSRVNIASGTTRIHAPDGTPLDQFTLTQPLDLTVLDDARCLHGVTPVVPIDADRPSWRDVLVITYTDATRAATRGASGGA